MDLVKAGSHMIAPSLSLLSFANSEAIVGDRRDWKRSGGSHMIAPIVWYCKIGLIKQDKNL